MEGVHILGPVYGIYDLGLINVLWERQLHEYSIHRRIPVQGIYVRKQLGFARAFREFHESGIHTHVRGRLHLVSDVHLTCRVFTHDDHGERRLAPETLFKHLHPGLNRLLHSLGNGLAVDDTASSVLQGPVSYIPAVEEIVAADFPDLGVYPVCGFGDAAAFANQHHHPSASGNELTIPYGRAHMVYLCIKLFAAFDDCTLVVGSRIAFGGEHYAHGHGLLPFQRLRLAGKGHGLEYVVNVALEQRQHHLGLRIPETGIEFYHLDSLRRLHQSAVKHSAQRAVFPAHCSGCRLHYLLVSVIPVAPVDERKSGIGAHASGIRSPVAVEGALVVLGKRHRIDLFPVHEAHEGELGTGEEILDHYPALAEAFVEKHHLQGLLRFLEIGGYHHSLACSQSVIFQDCRERTGADIGEGLVIGAEGLVSGGRDAVFLHELLGKLLAALDAGGGKAMAEDGQSGSPELIHNTLGKRSLGTNHCKVHAFLEGKFPECLDVSVLDRHILCLESYARIARGAENL